MQLGNSYAIDGILLCTHPGLQDSTDSQVPFLTQKLLGSSWLAAWFPWRRKSKSSDVIKVCYNLCCDVGKPSSCTMVLLQRDGTALPPNAGLMFSPNHSAELDWDFSAGPLGTFHINKACPSSADKSSSQRCSCLGPGRGCHGSACARRAAEALHSPCQAVA